MIKKLMNSLRKKPYFFYDQETGDGTVIELKGGVKSGLLQIEKDGQLIDIQVKNIYKSNHEIRVNYIQLKR